ncbi:MAG: hypothetical protein DMG88_18345 [Acidobacteria bacterium]|nr:MAG: hypothetical protein DMG88_18345 [Acidobacteriota bacterium]
MRINDTVFTASLPPQDFSYTFLTFSGDCFVGMANSIREWLILVQRRPYVGNLLLEEGRLFGKPRMNAGEET